MHTKAHLLKIWYENKYGNNENVNFLPKDVQRILSSYKNSEKYNEQEVLYENSAILAGRLCWILFFNKNTGLQACNFTKKRLQHRLSLDNTAKFLRTAILKNICERLLLRVFPFMLV